MANHRFLRRDSQRNSIDCAIVIITLALGLATAGFGGAGATTTQRIWNDAATGLAIGGYDPIAYFTDARPRRGRAEYEFSWRGVTWRFANEGNKAVFEHHPSLYAPQFGGYDALGIAKGRTGAGSPEIWVVDDNKLYLFFSQQEKQEWMSAKAKWISAAKRNWAKLMSTLPD